MSGAGFDAPMFNESEFNQLDIVTDIWTLYVDLGYTQVAVYIGISNRIPADKLYPNSEYIFRRTGTSPTVEILFSTPPALAYDGLGG
jgi:hypothetical protein